MKLEYDIFDPHPYVTSQLAPIIFLHGMADTKKSWKHVAPDIAMRTFRKAYVLDSRNHGASPRSPEMNYDVMTQDLLEFMDSHCIDKAAIVGHSMGGRTAITFALTYPQRVDVLVIEDMSPRNVYSSRKGVVFKQSRLFLGLLESLPCDFDLEELKKMVLKIILSDQPEEYIEKMYQIYDFDQMPVKKVGDAIELEFDMNAVLSLIANDSLVQNLPEKNMTFHGDSLFLYGSRAYFKLDKDPSVRNLFPRAVLKKIEDTYHFIHYEKPDIFISIVSEFILHRNLNRSKY